MGRASNLFVSGKMSDRLGPFMYILTNIVLDLWNMS
jgi:hypothetical protein